jgi:ParB family chromosome partitioning protein
MQEIITKTFANQCLAFPARVEAALASISTVGEASDMLAKAQAMSRYAEKLKAGIEIERPIAIGVLKIKAKIGELAPAKPPKDRGQGRAGKSSNAALPDFPKPTIAAYRKLAKAKDKLDEYYGATDDVPTQAGFINYIAGVHVNKASGENEWYTPPVFIEAARKAMGSIDLDPASCETAQANVRAKRFYSIDDDGLAKKWKGNVWMNPPYSKELCAKFIDKLLSHATAGDITQACVLVNNATETGWGRDLLAGCSAVCFPSGRIKFLGRDGKPANSPLQGQMITYFGPHVCEFLAAFIPLGEILFKEPVGIHAGGRLDSLRRIVGELEPHEAAVVRDWITERIN